jgi:ATP-dependent Lhr-like helicase
VSAADFMRFLLAWQHVAPPERLSGVDGLRKIASQLDGFETAAKTWERTILPARVERYEPGMLDMLCLTGEIGWAGNAGSIALFVRENRQSWLALRPQPETALSAQATQVMDTLRRRGALFARELGLRDGALQQAVDELVAAGLIASDGFPRSLSSCGRWSILEADGVDWEDAVEVQARSLLRRYGVVFRRLLTRESGSAPWRDLARVYRRLEARGEIRGGRFVSGMSGEQFALSDAVERLREVRREGPEGRLIVISGADPLNLCGIVTAGDRVRAVSSNRIALRDGVPVSVMEGEYLRPLATLDGPLAAEVATALAGRPVPVVSGFVGRPA